MNRTTKTQYIDFEELDTPMHAELNDYREERKIMREELAEGKDMFAEELKSIGQHMKETLKKNEELAKKKKNRKKNPFILKINNFFDRLFTICN